MNAGEIMTENPTVLAPEDTLANAVDTLQGVTFRHVPVVNEAGELVGMVSDRDLRALMVPNLRGDRETVETTLANANAQVSTVMSSDVLSVDTEDDVTDVANLMVENKIGAVPVVDAERRVVGIVSYVDLLRYYTGNVP